MVEAEMLVSAAVVYAVVTIIQNQRREIIIDFLFSKFMNYLVSIYFADKGMVKFLSRKHVHMPITLLPAFLASLLVPKMPSLFWKWTLSISILLVVLFEGFSRIFHGNHYLTDIVGGYALGIAWVVLVCKEQSPRSRFIVLCRQDLVWEADYLDRRSR